MKLINTGFDDNSTYFEHNIDSSGVPNIFIHGVGLDNNMWLPQKEYFKNHKIIFYDLINHGKTKKGYKEIYFENFNQQLIQLLDYLKIKKCNLVGFSIKKRACKVFEFCRPSPSLGFPPDKLYQVLSCADGISCLSLISTT